MMINSHKVVGIFTFTLCIARAALADVTKASLELAPANHSGVCPVTLQFSGRISVDQPGTTVQYTWLRSDGLEAPVSSLFFAKAGTKDVDTSWTLGHSDLSTFSGWQQVKVLKPNLRLSNQARFSLRCERAISVPPNLIALVLQALTCPDLAAQKLDFTIVSKSRPFAGRVRILGTVKNVGLGAYKSQADQQVALLLETNPGGAPRLVAHQPFHDLTPGAEVNLHYEREWDASSPAEGEFPPDYRLMIAYDPDILLDSNTRNDDCRGTNNWIERNGSDINALFR